MSSAIHIFRSLEEARPVFGPSALTIGNFDGVHAGHRRILRRVAELARQNGWKPSLLTFDPHPTKVVAPTRSPRLMTTPEQRCRLMEQEGIEQVTLGEPSDQVPHMPTLALRLPVGKRMSAMSKRRCLPDCET